jgi:hypothetical protein
MLRAAFLGCAFILPALFASAIPGRFKYQAKNLDAENAQISFGHCDNYQLDNYQFVCQAALRSISPTLQVFSPGAVFCLLSELLPTAYIKHQALLNSRKTSLIGPTRAHRYPRAPCGLAQQRTSASSLVTYPPAHHDNG